MFRCTEWQDALNGTVSTEVMQRRSRVPGVEALRKYAASGQAQLRVSRRSCVTQAYSYVFYQVVAFLKCAIREIRWRLQCSLSGMPNLLHLWQCTLPTAQSHGKVALLNHRTTCASTQTSGAALPLVRGALAQEGLLGAAAQQLHIGVLPDQCGPV